MRTMPTIANRGVLQIFVALLLVLVVMFVSNYIVFKNSISGIYRQVSENNRLVVGNVIQSFDDQFRNMNNLLYAINRLPDIPLRIMDEEGARMVHVYAMQKDMAALVASASLDYIEEAVIHYSGSDLAITASGTISLQHLFTEKYRHDTYGHEFWRTFGAAKHLLKVFPESAYSVGLGGSDNRRQSRNLLVVAGNNHLSNKNVLLLIDTDKLLQRVNQKTMMRDTSLLILDQDRNAILSTEENWDLLAWSKELHALSSRETTVQQKDYEYNVRQSNYNNFTYIDKAPYRFQNIESVSQFNRLIMATAIVFAIMLSAILSVYLYRPVSHILKLIGGGYGPGGDYRHIRSGIARMQAENESRKQQMDLLRLEMRRSYFLDALDDTALSQQLEARLREYFTDFLSDKFMVMGEFHLKPIGADGKPVRADDLTAALQAGMKRRLDKVVVFHAGRMQFLALMEVHLPADRRTIIRETTAFIHNAEAEGLRGYRMLVALSEAYPATVPSFRSAYKDLQEIFYYRNINVSGSIMDLSSIRFTRKVHFPLDEIDKLSNCLVKGDAGEGLRMINRIMDENLRRNIHHYQLVTLAKCVLFHLLKHLEWSDLEQKRIVEMETRFGQNIENAFNHDEIREILIELFGQLSNNKASVQTNKLNPGFIAQYIELHYMEDLYLDRMAEALNTTPKYFSNYFKKKFGVNYVEYLNKVRIAHAKQLLQQSDYPITVVGEKTGYANSKIFAGTFKKHCGVSPSDYRKKFKS